jgi:hypothetical protein
MGDTTCIAFIFAYINTYGPPLGLKLSRDKCEILFGTHDFNLFQTFPIDIVTGLVWATSTFCRNQYNFSEFTILGVPIGGPIYTTTSSAKFSTDFASIANIITNKIQSPASKLCLYLQCLLCDTSYSHILHGYTNTIQYNVTTYCSKFSL